MFYRRFAERHLETLQPLPGAEEMLRDLAERRHLPRRRQQQEGRLSAQGGGAPRLECATSARIVGAFDAARDKPAVDPVLLALAGSGIAPGPDVWFAGDADIDLRMRGQCRLRAGARARRAARAGEFAAFPAGPACRPGCMTLSKVVESL